MICACIAAADATVMAAASLSDFFGIRERLRATGHAEGGEREVSPGCLNRRGTSKQERAKGGDKDCPH